MDLKGGSYIMLDKQVTALTAILRNEDLKNYAGDAFWNLIKAIFAKDVESGLIVTNDIREIIFHTPTILFWDKMKRYLYGTFSDYEEQIKMAGKFNSDNNEYEEFVKRQIHLINELNDDKKIDYFAMLTRSFLLGQLEHALFYKLANFIKICTPYELEYIQSIPCDFISDNNIMISSLYQYGLFEQEENSGIKYVLSDFGKALKQNALNFNDGLNGQLKICSYKQISPIPITEPATWESFQATVKDQTLILDGGKVI